MDIAVGQGIIKRIKENNHTYYIVVNDKPYEPITFIESRLGASKQEATLARYFIDHNIPFIQQAKYEWCKHKKCLPFDFLVTIDGNEFLVEIQGRQHYEFIPYFHKTHDAFLLQQKRDEIKKISARENDMELLCIKYDTNVVQTFEDYLCKQNN